MPKTCLIQCVKAYMSCLQVILFLEKLHFKFIFLVITQLTHN